MLIILHFMTLLDNPEQLMRFVTFHTFLISIILTLIGFILATERTRKQFLSLYKYWLDFVAIGKNIIEISGAVLRLSRT